MLMFVIGGLLLAMIAFPYIFKDRILNEIKFLAEKHVDAQVNFDDINISLFRSFPQLNIKIEKIELTVLDTFHNTELFGCEEFEFDMNITPLFNKKAIPAIQYIGLKNPEVNLISLNNGLVNFDIIKSGDGDASPFEIEVQSYEIENGSFFYTDYKNDLKIKITTINHIGKGNFSQNIFDLNTETYALIDYVSKSQNNYLENINFQWQGAISMDQISQTYTLKENLFQLSKLRIDLSGSYQLLEDLSIIDLKFDTPSNSVEEVLSVLPFIQQEIPVTTRGYFNLNGIIKGNINAQQKVFPLFTVQADLKQAYAKYEGFQYPIEAINGQIIINNPTQSLENLNVSLNDFKLKILNDQIKGKLKLSNITSSPYYTGDIHGAMNVFNWHKAIPLKDIKSMDGRLGIDLVFESIDSAVRQEEYDKISLTGHMTGSSIAVITKSDEQIRVKSFDVQTDNRSMNLQINDLLLKDAHFDIRAEINNPISFITTDFPLRGQLSLKSKYVDVNKFINSESNGDKESFDTDQTGILFENFKVNTEIDQLLIEGYKIKDLQFSGTMKQERLNVEDLKLEIEDSDLDIRGTLNNISAYINNKGLLNGNILIQSNQLNLNSFIADTTESNEVVKIPKDLNITAQTSIKELNYDNLELKNVRGQIGIGNGAIELREVDANLLGGQILFDAKYDSDTDQPTFDSKIDLSKIQFTSAFNKFTFFHKVTPLIQYIDGFFNSTLIFSGSLLNDMTPNYNTLDVTGYIETLNSSIKNIEPIVKIAEKLNVKELKSLPLENTRNWFELNSGTFILKKRDLRIEGINSVISGTHQINGTINYELTMEIPRQVFSSAAFGKGIDHGIQNIEQEAKKIGINIESGEFINIKIILGNTLNNPTIKLVPLGTLGQSVQSELNQKIEQSIQSEIDTIKKSIKKKAEDIEDSIKSKLSEEAGKVKDKVNEKAKEETTKILDKAKEKSGQLIDTTISNAISDSLKSKIDEVLKNKKSKDMEDIIKDWDIFKKKKKGN
jgi:hypothetical protein